jgi:hypothetical protein
MKILLASLMCLVLGASQCFAHKGGPTYPAGTNLVGTYAGVLQGVFDPTNPASSNSIGVFSLGVPSTGNAHGSFIMFSRGRIFTGTTNAFADPNHGTLKGILDASFNSNLSRLLTDADGTQHIDTISVTATANGPINATVAQSQSASFFALATTILRGDATLSISQGGVAANGDPIITSVLSLTVSGVKQSDSVSLF